MVPTLWTNGWFGGFSTHPYFWFNTQTYPPQLEAPEKSGVERTQKWRSNFLLPGKLKTKKIYKKKTCFYFPPNQKPLVFWLSAKKYNNLSEKKTKTNKRPFWLHPSPFTFTFIRGHPKRPKACAARTFRLVCSARRLAWSWNPLGLLLGFQ